MMIEQKSGVYKFIKKISKMSSFKTTSQEESGEDSKNGTHVDSSYQKSISRPSITSKTGLLPPGPLRLPTLQEQQEDEEKGSQYDRKNSINQSSNKNDLRSTGMIVNSGGVISQSMGSREINSSTSKNHEGEQMSFTQAANLTHKNSLKHHKTIISR